VRLREFLSAAAADDHRGPQSPNDRGCTRCAQGEQRPQPFAKKVLLPPQFSGRFSDKTFDGIALSRMVEVLEEEGKAAGQQGPAAFFFGMRRTGEKESRAAPVRRSCPRRRF
jgi:hypothetical protein